MPLFVSKKRNRNAAAASLLLGFGVLVHIRTMMVLTEEVLRGKRSLKKDVVGLAAPKSLNLCSLEEMTEGLWVNVSYSKPPYIPNKDRRCQGFDPRATPFKTYEWNPFASLPAKQEEREDSHTTTTPVSSSSPCTFSQFDPEIYCPLVANKTVLIIGDSLSFDHFLSLTYLLGVPQDLPRVRDGKAIRISHTCNTFTAVASGHHTETRKQQSMNTTTTTTGIDDDTQITDRKMMSSKLVGKRDFFLSSVPKMIETYRPQIIILNRGAHYKPDAELIRDLNNTVIPALKDWKQKDYCRQGDNDECLFVWRTSVPGHPGCKNFTEPSTSIDEMEELYDESKNPALAQFPQLKNYYWNKFKGQNKLALDLLQQEQNAELDVHVMDAYPVNILRPDMHGLGRNDCLHTCHPKDNTYATMLQHILRLKYSTAMVSAT